MARLAHDAFKGQETCAQYKLEVGEMLQVPASIQIDLSKIVVERLKEADNWNIGQRIAAVLVLLWAIGLLFAGVEQAKVVLAAGIAITGVSLLTIGQRVLRPQTLLLKDKRGRDRALLTSDDELTSLVLLDSRGNQRFGIGCTTEGSSIVLFTEQGKSQLKLSTSDRGAPILEMSTTDVDTDPSVSISPAAVGIVNSDRRPVAYLAADAGRGYVMITGDENRGLIRLGIDKAETPGFLMNGPGGGIVLGGVPNRVPSMVLLDASGKPIRDVFEDSQPTNRSRARVARKEGTE